MVSMAVVDGREAPGLNEKAGKAGDFDPCLLSSALANGTVWRGSIAERGRLPVALEKEEGAEADDGRAGKTKCGFGGGGFERGDVCELEGDAMSLVAKASVK
jgi:hypothetical protein